MNKALIEGANANPRAPDGMEDHCGNLPVRFIERPDVGVVCESAWKPTQEELVVLLTGGYVVLGVVGGQPPVYLTVTDNKGAQEL